MRIARGSDSSTSRFVMGPSMRPIVRNGPAVWAGVSTSSVIVRLLERCRFAAAQNDVEAEPERPVRLRQLQVELRDEPSPGTLVGDRVEDRIEREERVAREVHLRDEPLREGATEHREVDVPRTPG